MQTNKVFMNKIGLILQMLDDAYDNDNKANLLAAKELLHDTYNAEANQD